MVSFDSFNGCVLLYSGGLDSTVLLHALVDARQRVHALSFDYGQRHRRELPAAIRIAAKLGVPHPIIALPTGVFSGSSLTDGPRIPHGRYDDAQQQSTVVPNRNMVMLSVATAYAISHGFDTVAYAAHADDNAVYPDCRPAFISAMEAAMRVCHYTPINLIAPFASMHKRDIVRLGRSLSVDFGETWSCYEGGPVPCGACGACDARNQALGE